jgi:hypothetical protein
MVSKFYPPLFVDLLNKMLEYDYSIRKTADEMSMYLYAITIPTISQFTPMKKLNKKNINNNISKSTALT